MKGILKDTYQQITQRELHQHARELG